MQKRSSNKHNEPDSFFKVLFATLARVGNILIMAFGLIFYGIRKLIYAIKKQKHEQTLYEFLTELDKHLNPAGKAHDERPRAPYSASKVPHSNSKTGVTVVQKPKEISKTPQKIVRTKPRKHGLALNITVKKFLPKIVMATLALIVVISSIFIFKDLPVSKKKTW